MEDVQNPDLSNGILGQNTSKSKASWDDFFKEHFVTLLCENAHMYQGYKRGWSKETWKQITAGMRARFPETPFSMEQLKQLEQDLKKNYKNIKGILVQPGFTWDDGRCTLQASDDEWSRLLARDSKAKKWHMKIFPCYRGLDALYGGHYVPQAMNNNALLQQNSSQFTSNSAPADSMNPSGILARVNQTLTLTPEDYLIDPEGEGELDLPNGATSQNQDLQAGPQNQPSFSFEQFGLADQNAANGVNNFSIALCVTEYERLGANKDDLSDVGDIFRDDQNCEIFLSLREDLKMPWLQEHIMIKKKARLIKSR